MAEARRKDEWNRASHLLALLANCNRNPKERREPFTPAEFDPFRAEEAKPRERIRVANGWEIVKKSFSQMFRQ